ncbi:MAG: hypothetical protein JWN08_2917 [Frankiales bacterium]|nr:hypothetical protein [Frankiales bacterium]
MPNPSPTAVRLVRAAVACVLLVLLAVPAPTASAAGTGGIEVTPVPGEVDGRPVTSFRVEVPGDGERRIPFLLRNVEPGERSARLFVAPVTRAGESFALGRADGSPYVSFEAQDVTLAEGESRQLSFTVRGGELPADEVLAAVVVQVGNGSVVQRASTLIYLSPGRRVPLPVLLLVVAGVLVAAAGTAVALVGRRRRA